jgi:hypothetical protein
MTNCGTFQFFFIQQGSSDMKIGLFFSVFIIELFLKSSPFFQKECFKCQEEFEFRLKPGLLRAFTVRVCVFYKMPVLITAKIHLGFCFSEQTNIMLINNSTAVYTAILARQNVYILSEKLIISCRPRIFWKGFHPRTRLLICCIGCCNL